MNMQLLQIASRNIRHRFADCHFLHRQFSYLQSIFATGKRIAATNARYQSLVNV